VVPSPKAADASTRKTLALALVGASVAGIALISVIAIAFAGDSRAETSRLVFSSVLPLLGTWVGTVIAFYFARENLAAATESTLALAGREAGTPVTGVMIRRDEWLTYDLAEGETDADVQLAAIHARMRTIDPPSRRLPIRSASGVVLHVIHDATLSAYAESQGETTATLTKTLGDLLATPDFKQLIDAIGFISEKATIADARIAMASTKYCNDVFVTASGKRDDPALGWLTNTLLAGVQ
jgi:hypothetical protein